jgi:hypothetical protein
MHMHSHEFANLFSYTGNKPFLSIYILEANNNTLYFYYIVTATQYIFTQDILRNENTFPIYIDSKA